MVNYRGCEWPNQNIQR